VLRSLIRRAANRRRFDVVALATFVAWACLVTQPIAGKGAGKPTRESKLDRQLQQTLREGGSARVIVRPRAGRIAQVKERLAARGKRSKADLRSVGAFTAELTAGELAALASDPDVETISSDAPVRSFADAATSTVVTDTLLEVLGIDDDQKLEGDHVGIAVVDSGLDNDEDFEHSRTDKFWNFLDNADGHPFDDYGHGTHVAGIVTGTGKRSPVKLRGTAKKESKLAAYRGIAPRARIYSFKVLDRSGAGCTSAVIEALEFITANKARLKIQIVNLSLGHPVLESAATDPLVLAVEAASREGLIVVASAGNYGQNLQTGQVGYAGVTSPGNAPSAITVGAYDTHNTVSHEDDTVPGYSSRGPTWYDGLAKPDLVAPGHGIVAPAAPESALFRDYPQRRVLDKDGKPKYFRLSGTSMAAAVTSGTIALMLERQFGVSQEYLTPNAVKALLQFTALPIPGYDVLTQGSGALNATGAIEMAGLIDLSAPLGAYWLRDTPSGQTTIGGIT
jgi:serine protease AprX